MISSSDKPRYSNTVVEFPPPLRPNPCANGLFQLISLMRVRTSARPRALASLAARLRIPFAPGSPQAQPTPPTTLWLARFARFAFAPGARSALHVFGGRLALKWQRWGLVPGDFLPVVARALWQKDARHLRADRAALSPPPLPFLRRPSPSGAPLHRPAPSA